jgi:2-keto-4-pentenoate hydratase/2-oxohepta-3-ene-1,7-dioic acid hydratase in catechol pathway
VAAGLPSPRWLEPGDIVRMEMTGLGRMLTPIVDETASDERSPVPVVARR